MATTTAAPGDSSGAAGPHVGDSASVEPAGNQAVEVKDAVPYQSRPEKLETFIDMPSCETLGNTASIVIHGKSNSLTPEETLVFIVDVDSHDVQLMLFL